MLITSSVDYVRWTQTTALYLDKLNQDENYETRCQEYEILGALDEVGEIAGLLKRELRDGEVLRLDKLALELGDLAWYLARIHYNHADAELDHEHNLYPIISKLGMLNTVKGMTCFDVAISVAEKLKSHFITREATAKFIFGNKPNSFLEMIKQIQEGLTSTSDDPISHFVFAMNRRVADSPTVGVLMHIASEANSMEAVLDWASICYKYNFDLIDILQSNVDKLESRKERGVLHGKGSDR